MKIKVAKFISQFLVDNGITDCFMVTGGGAMHLDDAIGHQEGTGVLNSSGRLYKNDWKACSCMCY